MPVDNAEFLAFLYRETGTDNPNQLAHKIKVGSGKLADWKAGRYAPSLRILKRIHEQVPAIGLSRLMQAAGIESHAQSGGAGQADTIPDTAHADRLAALERTVDKLTRFIMKDRRSKRARAPSRKAARPGR